MAMGQSDQGEFSVEIPSFLSCVKLEIKVNRGNLPPVNFEYWENISSERTWNVYKEMQIQSQGKQNEQKMPVSLTLEVIEKWVLKNLRTSALPWGGVFKVAE